MALLPALLPLLAWVLDRLLPPLRLLARILLGLHPRIPLPLRTLLLARVLLALLSLSARVLLTLLPLLARVLLTLLAWVLLRAAALVRIPLRRILTAVRHLPIPRLVPLSRILLPILLPIALLAIWLPAIWLLPIWLLPVVA